MKKITIILSVIVLVLLASEGFYFFKALTKKEVVAVVAPTAEKKPQIMLFKESGEVSYKRPADASFQVLTLDSMEIPNLTSVKTDSGRGTVLLPDNSVISLSENTEISVNFTEQSTSIFQSVGSTYHRVEALVSGKTYEVQTPGTLAAVRGTKFAISYDKVKAITKVAVTEHKVSVARIQKSFVPNVITPETKLEEVEVTEGNSAKIIEAPLVATSTIPGTKPVPVDSTPRLVVSKTDDDVELKTWIKENKDKDPIIEKIKTDTSDKKVYRKELEILLKSEKLVNPTPTDTIKSINTTKPIDSKNPIVPARFVATTTKPIEPIASTTPIKPITTIPTPVINKLSEEVFFDKFNNLFVKNFYVENDDGICALTTSSDTRVKEIVNIATNSGYPLPTGSAVSLKKFSDEIIYYCKNGKGDARARSTLQAKFDDEFPFKESI